MKFRSGAFVSPRPPLPPLALLPLLLILALCSNPAESPEINCRIDSGPCSLTDESGLRVFFAIEPRPVRPLRDLIFRVWIPEGSRPPGPSRVTLNLTMPGMYMGENRPLLRHVGRGRYEGKGFLPRCAAGGEIWRAAVDVARDGRKSSFAFIFRVPL